MREGNGNLSEAHTRGGGCLSERRNGFSFLAPLRSIVGRSLPTCVDTKKSFMFLFGISDLQQNDSNSVIHIMRHEGVVSDIGLKDQTWIGLNFMYIVLIHCSLSSAIMPKMTRMRLPYREDSS
jgi:hypothetical protein